MRVSLSAVVERVPGAGLRHLARPYATLIDSVLNGRDDRSVSQRIAVFTFAVRMVSAAIVYVSQVLLARWMGDFQYGVFVVVWVGAVVLGGLSCLGFHAAVLRFVPEYTEHGEMSLLRGVIVGSRVQSLIVATVVAIIGVIGLHAFAGSVASYYVVPLYLGAIMLPMLATAEIQDGLSRAFSWADIALWPTFIVRQLAILAFMAAAVVFGARANSVTAMGAAVAAVYLGSIIQFVWLQRRLKSTVPPGPRQYTPVHWVSVALPIFVVEGFFFMLTNIDVLIVGRLMAPDYVAVYYAATKTLALVHFIYFAVRVGSAQRFSKYYASGDHLRLAAFVHDTLHWTFWPSLAMVVLLLVLGKPLLLLFGPNFGSGYPLLFILSIGILARAAIGPAESLLTMAGQQRICAVVYTATFVLSIGLNFTLIPRFGLSGAATATTLALITESVVLYVIALQRLGIHSSVFTASWPARPAMGTP